MSKIDGSSLAAHALTALLGKLEVPIFVARRDGTVRYASALGQVRQKADPSALEQELRAVIGGERQRSGWSCTPLGLDDWFLLQAPANDAIQSCIDRARARFGLTPRQREVVDLLVGGATNQTIAMLLNITPRTVEVHLSAIYDRAGVDNRTSLVSLVLTAA